MITKYKMANLITYLGIACSTLAIYISFLVVDEKSTNIKYAFICFMIAGVCDMFDGTFARHFKRTEKEKEIGIQLDSLSDVISFLVVPVSLCIASGMDKWYHAILYIYYVMMGVTRLGFFNVCAEEYKQRGEALTVYRGLAVTYTSLIFPIVNLILMLVTIKVPTFTLSHTIMMIVMFIVGTLFVIDFPLPKPNKKVYILFSILAVVGIVVYVVI